MSDARKLRVGIIGCGGIAHHHLRGYQAAGAEVAAVYDSVAATAEKFAAGIGAHASGSLEQLLDAGLHAVSVCTPPGTHLACCEPFLRKGIAVLCEKPLEASLESATRLTEVVRETGTPFMIGFCHRFHGPIIELKRLISDGTLGRPLVLRITFSGWVPLAGNHRLDPRLSGGGVLADNGAHAVDLFRHLVGEPSSVMGTAANLVQDLPIEDFAALHLRTDTPAAVGEILSSYSLRDGANLVELYGSEGNAIVSYGSKLLPECAYKPHGRDEWIAVSCQQHPQRFIAEVGHFLNCIRTTPSAKPDVSIDDGLCAARIIYAAYDSLARGSALVPIARQGA